ncbi:MAG: hypothetical protein CYPHOPRED_004474, partial [Cyphobasidiales sp. Tagirdzhanova-0007]
MAYYPDGGALNIVDVTDMLVACIPIRFLEASGDRNWDFVLESIGSCVENTGRLTDSQGQALDLSSPVEAGDYVYVRDGNWILERDTKQNT